MTFIRYAPKEYCTEISDHFNIYCGSFSLDWNTQILKVKCIMKHCSTQYIFFSICSYVFDVSNII